MWSLPVLTFFQTLLVISTASLCNLLLSQMPGSRSPLGLLEEIGVKVFVPFCHSTNVQVFADRLLNLDVFEEPVNIWKGSNMELLGKSSPFYLQHGETLIFMRTEFGPPVVFEAADFFQESVKWYEFSHLPSCQDTRCLAVCTTEELYPVDPYYYRHVPSQEIALRSTGLDPTTHGVTEVDISPALDLDGETCATIQVITAADSCSDATGKGHYLLDLRPISRRPRMVTYEDTRHDLPDILSAAGVSFPSGQCGELLRTRVVGSIQVLTIGVVADLAEKIFNSGIWASVTPVTTSASGPPPPDSAPPWRHAQDRHAAGLHAPPRFDREPHSPSPHRALGLDEVTDTETMEELALPFQMGVHVMMPDFQDEILHVHLTAPCTVDHALSAISEARDTTASLHLDVLVPAHPQPDPSFACVLAIPAWTTHANFGVADLRAIDGRLFVHAFPARLNRSSLLLHFEVPDYPGLQVYIADQLLDPLPWYELPLAVTVTVLPPDFAFWPGHSLDMMLHRDWGWAVPCPTFGGLEGPNFLLLSDGNRRILKVDEARATSSAYLKQEAVRLFRYEEYKVTVCPTVPRTRNAAYLGWHCDAVFTATEAINRTPVPPGRLQTRQHIVFLDRRLLLQAFAWQLAPHGVLDWDKLLRRLQACAPEGFSVSIQGGRQEHKGMRTFLHVEHGEVLLCVPVADDQHTDAEQVSSTEPSMPGPSQSPASSDSSDSTSEKTGSAHVSQEHSVPDPARYEPASRSRSPANRRPITGHGARLARQTLMGMGCVHLGHPVHGHLMSSWLPASWEPPLPTALPIEGFRLGDFHQLSCATLPGTLLQQTSPVLTSLLLWTHTWQSALCQFLAYLAFLLSHALCPPSRQHGRVRRARDGPRANKQLDEPTGSTPADSLRLRTLRHITRVMGGRWLRNWSHQPLEAAPFGYPVPDDTESEPEDDTAQIHFVVLKHDYVPEHAVAPLHLPATQSEAMALLRDQRDPTARHLFPALLPVIPQPRQATACFLASPAWNPGWHTICIDTSRVDNRIFAAFVPEYATRRDILLLAEIPLGIDPIVWLGPSDSILEDDIRTHLFPGALVCVFPAEDVTPRLQSLGEMLLRPNLWQGESDFPEARGLRAYCLAHRRQGQLYVPDPSRPMNYRREIAEAVGSRPESLILFPARPRPQDVAISGVTCRTVIGVSDRRHSSSGLNAHMVLLDCRPVEEGWKAFWVPGTGLDLGQLLDLFDDSTPQGWQACVMELPRRHGLLPTEPGQVLTIFYAHSGIFEMGHNSPPGNSGPPPTTEPSHTTAPAQAAPAASAASAGVVQAAERNLPSSSPGLQAAVGQANAQPRTSLHFLVLTPEYAPEHITVQAELPARAEAIVLEVDAARDPAKRAFFPVPLPVPLQPAFSFVSLLAVPRWPFVGVPFLITCFLPPVHVLPVIGPAVLTAEGVLRLAGVNADAPARVFSSDAPWPLRWGDRFHVRQGDSITILPDDQPFIPPVPLQHFFDTSDGWRDDLIIPGPTEDAAWVLTEQIAWRLPASEQDGRSMRETVATQLQAHPDEVEVLPATPSIGDHCRFGFPSNRVFIAGPLDLPGHIPYIIDSRPVLTQLYWATAERGCVDVASICASHRHRCPRDHFVRLTGPGGPPEDEDTDTTGHDDPDLAQPSATSASSGTCRLGASLEAVLPFAFSSVLCARTNYPMDVLLSLRLQDLYTAGELAEFLGTELWTLLEESISSPNSQAYFLSATLLDTLEEHFGSTPGSTLPAHVSLEQCVPLSAHQLASLELQALIPEVAPAFDPADWLDIDLQQVISDPKLRPGHKKIFQGLSIWQHHVQTDFPHSIAIYTDGSANESDPNVPCSWAFTVWFYVHAQPFYYGGASSTAVPAHTPYHAGECMDNAVTAELLALFWAFTWSAQYAPAYGVPVAFYYDAISVGRGSFGASRAVKYPVSPQGITLPTAVLTLRHLTAARCVVSHHHVQGHSGHFANELTDRLACLAGRQPEGYHNRCLPEWSCRLICHPLAAWAWLQQAPQADLPTVFAFEAEAHRLQQNPELPTQGPKAGLRHHSPEHKEVTYQWSCISYNVLTLKDKPGRNTDIVEYEQAGMKLLGRRAILKQSLAEHSPLFVGLQETRLGETATLPDSTYVMYHSGSTPMGVGGCALWVHRDIPYATAGSTPYFLRQEHATITGVSFRHLNVVFVAPFLRLFVMVAHGPSPANHPIEEIIQFWRDRTQELQCRPQGTEVLLLTDANAKVGDLQTGSVGPRNAESENASGEHFHAFLLDAELFLPSTFPDFHIGPGATWFSSQAQVAYRLDYIGVPDHWRGLSLHSEVLSRFESLQLREDHRPVYLRVSFTRLLRQDAYHTRTRRAIRPDPPADQHEEAARIDSFTRLPLVPWSVPIDHQYEAFTQMWTTIGKSLQHKAHRQPIQSFVSDQALDYIDHRKALRVYIHQEEAERSRRLLLIAFAALLHSWRGTSFTLEHRAAACRWLSEIDHSLARAAALLRHFARQVRRQVAQDRRQYLASLTQQVQDSNPKDPQSLYRAVRKAFPTARSSRRSGLVPLPAVYEEDGRLADTPAAKQECWRRHFAAQELGDKVEHEEYLRRFHDRPITEGPVFDADVLPTLPEIEQIILGLKKHKAPGPDCVTADLLQVAPVAASRQLFPVLLKTTLMIQEPVEFRGGSLICLAKRAGAALQCKDFRSILLASVPAKIQHRHLRSKLLPLLDRHGHPTQAGAKAGISIEPISLLARSFQAAHQKRRLPWAITFYDLQAAFYRIVRETLVPSRQDDAALRSLLHRIGIPPTALEELAEQLRRVAALPSMGASPHLVRLIQDLFHATWFRMDFDDVLTCTSRGTRPGDPAADILFSLSFAAFIRHTEQTLRERGLEALPLPSTSTHPWAQADQASTVGFPAWADDFAHLQNATVFSGIIQRVQLSTQVVQERATAIGMRLTYAPDKTATLLPPGQDWLQHGAVQDDEDRQLYIDIVDRLTNTHHQLAIVPAYKHLGCILTSTGDPRPDLARKKSRALSVVRPLGRRLFGNRAIPLDTRRLLLRSLAISRFVYSGAALILNAALHQRTWDQAYIQIWRSLLPRKQGDKPAHGYSVLLAARAAAPPLALARARALLLQKLTQHGPAVLRTFLYDHWIACPLGAWLSQLHEDVKLITLYLPKVRGLLSSHDPVHDILDSLQTDPTWWPRQARAAEKAFLTAVSDWSLRHSDSATAQLPPVEDHVPPTPDLGSRPFACHQCDAAFPLRKHLGVHLARAHGILSPSRHFAFDVYCHGCHRWYGSVRQVQQHLKQSGPCLLRVCQVLPALSVEQIREVEGPEVAKAKQIAKGNWQAFEGFSSRTHMVGPPLPTFSERCQDLDFQSEDIPLYLLARAFRPSAQVIEWIQQHVDSRSTLGVELCVVDAAVLPLVSEGIQFTLVKAAMVTASVLDIDRFVRVQVSAKDSGQGSEGACRASGRSRVSLQLIVLLVLVSLLGVTDAAPSAQAGAWTECPLGEGGHES
ncbi:unnamed protein product [Symbiodinium microadriaticum]|nr:unnamed protein product [Symbiodinium microadriaticum]